MKRIALIALVLAGAAIVSGYRMLPAPARAIAPETRMPSRVRGAIHVHSRRSDGTGTTDEIASAAMRAGLTFVIVTDHGDATREPDAPAYRDGVLVIDAVEVSTDGGHVVAIGLPAAPYPLAGEPRDVIEDIARLGGMSIAAHPGSAKPDLRWLDWDAPVDGLEWLNGDSEWRDEPRGALLRALLTYPIRRAESLATLFDRPEPVIARWDDAARRRRVVAVAAADAHARLGLPEGGEPYDGAASLLKIPAYEQMFRAFSNTLPGVTLTGDAALDARMVVEGIRQGRAFSSIDALAQPATFSLLASAGTDRAGMGEELAAGRPITFRVETGGPPDGRIALFKDGEPIATGAGTVLERIEGGEPGVYRAEVQLPDAPGEPPVPWIVSNPIYVRTPGPLQPPTDPRGPPTEFSAMSESGDAAGWTVETSPQSRGALDVVPSLADMQLSLRYALGGTLSASPFVALVMPAGAGLSSYDRLLFTGRATHPMRVSVQLRIPDATAGERWHRSVYLDETLREITIAFDDMTPRGRTGRPRPELSAVRDVLFVIDTVNTRPGTSGQVWIDDVRYAR